MKDKSPEEQLSGFIAESTLEIGNLTQGYSSVV